MRNRTTRLADVAAAAALAVATTFCGGLEDLDENSEWAAPLSERSERETGAYSVREGDMLVKLDRRQLEILRIEVREGRAWGVNVYQSTTSGEEYKCDHDPPQQGDSCTCGGHTGPGSGVLNIFDCGLLQLDCADGAFRGNSCSNWDGDPLPPP